jgi:hypothetical protein
VTGAGKGLLPGWGAEWHQPKTSPPHTQKKSPAWDAGRAAACACRPLLPTLTAWKRLVARLERTAGGSIALARLSTSHGMPAAAAAGQPF